MTPNTGPESYLVRFAQTPWQAHRHMEAARAKRERKATRRLDEAYLTIHGQLEAIRSRTWRERLWVSDKSGECPF